MISHIFGQVSILFSTQSFTHSPQSCYSDLAKKLKHRGYLNVSAVAKATVPIGGSSNDDVPMQPQCINANCPHRACLPAAVKCTDPKTGVTFDVNINNRLGVYNTALLRQYCLLDPSLPYFLKVVKLWMYSRGLNSASGRHGPPSFSSYAITIMTIALYQVRSVCISLRYGECGEQRLMSLRR